MILDRISLKIALKYLDQIEQNEGSVFNILFSFRLHHMPFTKSVTFENIEVLNAFIDKWASPDGFGDLNCMSLTLFELKAFSFDKNNTDNLVYNNGVEFVTKTANVHAISILNINNGYLIDIIPVKDLFESFKKSEYIFTQYEYIDCGYILIYFPEQLIALREMYNIYK